MASDAKAAKAAEAVKAAKAAAKRESDDAAWGGRGPSGSYDEWKAEGRKAAKRG